MVATDWAIERVGNRSSLVAGGRSLEEVKTLDEYKEWRAEFVKLRSEPLYSMVFTEGLELLMDHFKREELSDSLIRTYYDVLNEEMNAAEFKRAVLDVLKQQCYWSEVIARLIESVQRQREAEDDVCEAKLQQLWGGL